MDRQTWYPALLWISSENVDNTISLEYPGDSDSTGEWTAAFIANELWRVGAQEKVTEMSFDTKVSNTGSVQGACAHTEREPALSPLRIVCRRYIYRRILEDVFNCYLGTPSGPDFTLFKQHMPKRDSYDHNQRTSIYSSTSLVEFLDIPFILHLGNDTVEYGNGLEGRYLFSEGL